MTPQTATSTWKKIARVLLGLFLSLVLLEAGLRLSGFILTSIQAYENFRSIEQTGAYRILCLGESTTAGQYPRPLERILNRRHIGVQFSVIDKGKPTVNTLAILNRVEAYLDKYHPNMVVAMMGSNDKGVKYYQAIPKSDTWLFRHCRVYRFGRILYMHILKKIKRENIYGLRSSGPWGKAKPEDTSPIAKKTAPSNRIPTNKAINTDFNGIQGNPEPQNPYLSGSGLSEAEKSLRKAIKLHPEDDNADVRLGRLYRKQGELSRAEASFRRAIELDPKNDDAYVELARIYRIQGKYPAAEDSFQKAIKLNPKSDHAYAGLGDVYVEQDKCLQAENSFRKAVEINPKNDDAFNSLGRFYPGQGKFLQSEASFKKAIEINPKNDDAYVELARIYRMQDKLSEAEDFLRKAIELDPNNKRALGAMSSLYEEMGKPELAREYTEKVNALRSENYPAVTVNNYRHLKEILERKGIKLICVQYPMRNVALLKKIFENDTGVIFVDNERVFKEAVRKGSYKEYFRDMFAGDFGHCTQKGNMLLAQNIADVILREVFKK